MDKNYIEEEFSGTVPPGWWPILLKYLPRIQEIEPQVRFEIKEKWGQLDIFLTTDAEDGFWNRDTARGMTQLVDAAEQESKRTCECCGSPGKQYTIRGWVHTLCERCAKLSDDVRWAMEKETERRFMEE